MLMTFLTSKEREVTMRIGSPASLSDAQLTARVKHLVRYESHATAELVAHLAEFDRRQLYLGAGCRFAPRCPQATERCATIEPAVYDVRGVQSRCHLHASEKVS